MKMERFRAALLAIVIVASVPLRPFAVENCGDSVCTVIAIAYTAADPVDSRYVIQVSAKSGEKRTLALGAAPAWSPDGQKIAFCAGDKTLASSLLWRESSSFTGIRITMVPGLIVRPEQFSGLSIINADGTGLKKMPLPNKTDGACEPAWSPEGMRIAYVAYSKEHHRSEIYIASETGANPTFITAGYRPEWSPDGQRLTFFRAPHGPGSKSSVWVVNTDGTNLYQLTDEKSVSWTPMWTADGKIMFASDQEGASAIYEVNPDGTGLKRIAANQEFAIHGGLYLPRPSPDGTRLIVDTFPQKGGARYNQTILLELDGTHRANQLMIRGMDVAVRWGIDAGTSKN